MKAFILYLGLRCVCYVEQDVPFIGCVKLSQIQDQEFVKNVKDDSNLLKSQKSYRFELLEDINEPVIYCFSFCQHSIPNQTKFSTLYGIIPLKQLVVSRSKLVPSQNLPDCSYLRPFFEDDEYFDIDSSQTELLQLSHDLAKINNDTWDENHWTSRLACCLTYLPLLNDHLILNTTTLSFREMLNQLKVSSLLKRHFLFHGTTDILLSKKICLVLPTDTDKKDVDINDILIENCYQQQPLQVERLNLPEKTGQVIASLHILLVAEIMKFLKSGKPFHKNKEFTVKGLLIDKIIGAVKVQLCVKLSSFSEVQIKVWNYTKRLLSSEYLLRCLELLIDT